MKNLDNLGGGIFWTHAVEKSNHGRGKSEKNVFDPFNHTVHIHSGLS